MCTQRIKPSRGLFLCIRAIITSLHLCHVTGEYFFLCHDVYPLFVVSKVPVEGVWPYRGHFQLHRQSWPLDWIGNCLIQLAIVNHEEYYVKLPESELRCEKYKRSK